MHLKDVIATVVEKSAEANKAFRTGQQHVAERYLGDVKITIDAYIEELAKPAGNVSTQVDSEASSEGLSDQKRAAQDSAGNEPMLNFTEHIKKIEYLADRILVDVQAEKLEDVRVNLKRVSIFNNEALQQLDELIKLQQH